MTTEHEDDPELVHCGRCGGSEKTMPGARYNSLCHRCKDPHQLMTRQGEGDEWRCDYCGKKGTMHQLETTNCSHFYPPCPSCHQHPFCARDCPAIGEALSSPGVYVAGFGPGPEH